jgi:hypothetical protein
MFGKRDRVGDFEAGREGRIHNSDRTPEPATS